MRKEKGKFFVSSQSNSRAGSSNKADKTIQQQTKSSMSEQERIEWMVERRLSEEKAAKQMKNYIQIGPDFLGLRIKIWFIIAAIDFGLFWYILLNVKLTEGQIAFLFLGSVLGPIFALILIQKMTGIEDMFD